MDRLGATGAVVLERLARGGGGTKWYYCSDRSRLESVEERLSPGSVVSFYFDGRIRSDLYSPDVESNVENIIAEEGEAVIGRLHEDGCRIEIETVAGPGDLAEFISTINPTSRLFYGTHPTRDNDGIRAVTVLLPDADTIARAHPR